MNIQKVRKGVITAFFPLIMIDYFLIMLDININSIIMLPLLFLIGLFSIRLFNIGSVYSKTAVILMFIWFVYNVSSILICVLGSIPLECYGDRLKSFVFPMLFFFYGLSETDTKKSVYQSFIWSAFFCFAIGLFLYFFTPSFYLDFLVRVREETWYIDNKLTEDNILSYTRFGSFFNDSYAVSYFSIPAICLAGSYWLNPSFTKKKVGYLLVVVLSFVSAILCQQRVAMVYSSAIVLFIFPFMLLNKKKAQKWTIILIALIVLAVVMVTSRTGFGDRITVIQELLNNRINEMSLSTALNERTSQYSRVLASWSNILLGDGLGSHSGAAMRYGFPVVNDGEYFRILVESGVLGFLVFIILIGSSIIRAGIMYKRLWPEFYIILFYLVAAIGSNSLSINFIYSPIFWYCLGMIWNDRDGVSAYDLSF